MGDLKTDKPKEKIVLEYYEADLCKVLAYRRFIQKHLALKNKIPARVLKSFIEFFNEAGFDVNKTKETFIINAKIKALADIEKYKQSFSFCPMHNDAKIANKMKSIRIKNPKPNIEIPLPVIMADIFRTVDKDGNKTCADFINRYYNLLAITGNIDVLLDDKKALIDHVSKELIKYLNEPLNKSIKGYPTQYKQTIIVGLILLSFGRLHDKETWQVSNSKYKVYTAYLNKSVEYWFLQSISPDTKN